MTPVGRVPAGKLRSVVTYMEMTERPSPESNSSLARPTLPPPGVSVSVPESMPVSTYLSLYRGVGEAWLWWERLRLSVDELADILSHPAVEVRTLFVNGALAGYSELDGRIAGEIELTFFGLMPSFIGRGLGRFLLETSVAAAWRKKPRRLWLHTCSEDHPFAASLYRRVGFRPYRTDTTLIDDPRRTGLLPVTAAPHVPMADI